MSLVIGDSCDADCENVDVTEEDDNVFIASGSVIEESAGTASSLSGLTVLCARRPTIPLIHVGGGEETSSNLDELHSSRPSGLRPEPRSHIDRITAGAETGTGDPSALHGPTDMLVYCADQDIVSSFTLEE